ncbi:MAG: methyltransferase domain-containing protein [Deltaproteobacteria bacterium]|nr:methyltransferase domain-containing protein [Deltaproteobacteria bacterium]
MSEAARAPEPFLCPVCRSGETEEFFLLRGVPIHCNLLWQSRDRAVDAPRGDLRLRFCHACGHVFNSAFRAELMEYSERYENSLHFSPFFQEYARALAQELRDRYGLRNKHVVEIGCGKGEFLTLLCREGDNRGTGFDTSYEPGRHRDMTNGRVTFVRDFFGPQHAHLAPDLVVCRHVLEHVENPLRFLVEVKETLRNCHEAGVFFEVPNAMFIFRDLSIWDLIYEHCGCFTRESLRAAFQLAGFCVSSVGTAFSRQFLTIEAQARNGSCPGIWDSRAIEEKYVPYVQRFSRNFQDKVEEWSRRLQEIQESRGKVVVWGAGSKGAGFLNMVPGADKVRYVVDINPHKQGKHVAGSGQTIVNPEFLTKYRPKVILVMNPAYLDEIRRMCEAMGLAAQLLRV